MEKILLIEDDKVSRDVATHILQLANYEVLSADNGQDGIEIALTHKPDVIVCDLAMPVLDGYGVLHVAQKHPALRHTPFILCSNVADLAEVRRAMASGADDFITKPFSSTDLLDSIESRLRKHRYAEAVVPAAASMPSPAHVPPVLGGERWEDVLQALVGDRNINTFAKRQTICQEGQRVQKVYYVLKGKVRAFLRNDNGKELAVELYGSGDFIGHEALLGDGMHRESVDTLEYCELAVIPREDMEQVLYCNAEVRKVFFRMLCKSVQRKQRYLLVQAYDSLRRKVAQALLRLNSKYGGGQSHFEINLSREVMASIAGTATESLIRTLGDFKSEGMVEVEHNGLIRIKDVKRLESIYF